jgi:thymidylate synthase ThyX
MPKKEVFTLSSPLVCLLLSKEEEKLLSYFVTNLHGNVYGFKNVPQVVMGAIFAAYSRSPLSAREILVKKFLGDEEFLRLSGEIDRFLQTVETAKPMVDPAKAESFYDRVLVQYGDDSVAELATTHMAIENVSNVVVKLIEDRRIGLNPLEKSTRYVQFNEKDNMNHYKYVRDEVLMQSPLGEIYTQAMDALFDTYTELLEPLKAHFQAKFPQKDDQSDTAYAAAIRAQACDVLRYLLPMGTLTNMGVVGNGRAYEYLIQCLEASPFPEAHDIATKLLKELREVLPAFVRRIETERGKESIQYLRDRAMYEKLLPQPTFFDEPNHTYGVRLVDWEKDAETQVAAALLFESSEYPLDEIQAALAQKTKQEVRGIIRGAYAFRGHRTHKPSRAFEHSTYTFDIVCDIGAYRDLQRHRVLTQQRQTYTIDLGYVVPQDIIAIGAEEQYRRAMDGAKQAYDKIIKKFPAQAQYAVPFGYLIRFTFRLNAREAFHLCELRSTIQGHWSYRYVAQQMAKLIGDVHPAIGDGMMIDWSESGEMARLKAEQRQEEKLGQLGLERDY